MSGEVTRLRVDLEAEKVEPVGLDAGLQADIAAALDAYGDAVAALRAGEWEGTANAYGPNRVCPVCRGYQSRGHIPGCEVGAALVKAKEMGL